MTTTTTTTATLTRGQVMITPGSRPYPGVTRGSRTPVSGRRGERGSASAELVIATPLLLLLLLGIVQFALWEHATHIAQAAAEQGLAAARVQGASPAAGQQQAGQVLAQLGTGVLTGPTVRTSTDGPLVQVTITGRAEPVLPFLHLPVTATATGPLDAFYPAGTTP